MYPCHDRLAIQLQQSWAAAAEPLANVSWLTNTASCVICKLSSAPYTLRVTVLADEFLDALARRWEVPLPTEARASLARYVNLLLEWNVRVNLTAARDVAEVVGEHLIDAIAMARLVPSKMGVCDIGSGGGLPGIPFGILRPDCALTLVEPRAKRVAFLRTAVRELGLSQARVIRERAEEIEERFDVAGARATFAVEEWLGLGSGLVKVGGLVLVFSSAPIAAPGDWEQVASLGYETRSGHSRCLGAFRSRAPNG